MSRQRWTPKYIWHVRTTDILKLKNNNIYISIAQIVMKMFKCALPCRLKRLHISIINIKLILWADLTAV